MTIVAAIQMCSSERVDENLKKAEIGIQEAASKGAKLIVLPEMFAIISNQSDAILAATEKSGLGKIQSFLSDTAAKNHVWIVGGTIPVRCEKNPHKMRSACMVFDDKGNMVARYDKMHLFDAVISEAEKYKESDNVESGDEVVVIDTPIGRLGLAVCYDIRFPELFVELANRGAQVIAIPSAFTVKTGQAHWQLLLRARAVETLCYVIGSAQTGAHESGRKTYGHSMIIEPWGNVLVEARGDHQSVIYADIDLKKQHQLRKMMPVLEHHKIKKLS